MSLNKNIIVVPLSRQARRLLPQLKISCTCVLAKEKRKVYINNFFKVVDELLLSRSFIANYRVTSIKRLIFLCKLLVKRPEIVFGALFFHRTFQLVNNKPCFQHHFLEEKKDDVWYSASAAKKGFPWPYSVFLNSLLVIRNKQIQLLVFGLDKFDKDIEKNSISSQASDLSIPVDMLTLCSRNEREQEKELLSWSNTKLYEVSNAEISHGSVLTQNQLVFVQDLDHTLNDEPIHLAPNSLWFSRMDAGNVLLNSPKSENLGLTLDSCVFVNSVTDNFFHFLSESLRVLLMSIEAGIEIKNIVIRSELPFQFYEIIQQISPKSTIIKVGKGEKIKSKKIAYTQYDSKLSSDRSLFRDMPLQKIKESDEWRTWIWFRQRFPSNSFGTRSFYIPRRRHQSRGIVNSDSLEKRILKNKFEILDTENSGFLNQVHSFSDAGVICSTTGASLLNMIFMPKGATVIEICYPSNDNWSFLADLCELNYVKIQINTHLPHPLLESLDVYRAPTNRIVKSIRGRE